MHRWFPGPVLARGWGLRFFKGELGEVEGERRKEVWREQRETGGRPEARGRRSEVRSQRSEAGSQKPEASDQWLVRSKQGYGL
jgi:hypothetical protein